MATNLVTQVGVTGSLAKSFAYDEAAYQQVDPINLTIAAAASSSVLCAAFTSKQLKSITVVPTTAPAVNDQLTVKLTTLGGGSLVFGTATTINYTPTTVAVSGTPGTATATASNIITLTGKGNGLAAGQTIALGTLTAYNPYYVAIAGGTFDVVVANAGATSTQTAFVFPTGPSGGLSLAPGDVLSIAKGTDAAAVYQLEVELSFTPGSSVTK